MKFNISEILKSTVLLEGRLEDIKSKYPGNDEFIDTLSQQDPSGNNKYLSWMAKHALGHGADEGIPQASLIIQTVNDFDVAGDRLKKEKKSGDINSYKSVQQVIDTLNSLKRRDAPSKSQLKGKGDLIYNGEDVFVIAPRNWEGSCTFGSGAKWCIAQTSTDTHWNSYVRNNMFYFVTSKNLPSSDKNYKIAIQKNLETGKNTYWDVPDRSSSTPQNPEIDEVVLGVIDDHFIKAKKTIFNRLLEDMLAGVKSTQTTENFGKVKEIANDGQLYKLVLNNLNVLLEYRGADNFGYVLGRIGEDNMYKLLTTNKEELVKVLTSEKILTFLDEYTSREQKLELGRGLNQHLKSVSPNIRAKIQKWNMTDEDWQKYETTSTYVYLGDEETGSPSSQIYKVDKFEPSSYDVISELKLRLKYQSGLKLYGVATGKDELDQYLDSSNVPSDVMDNFKKQVIPVR